MIVDLFLYSFLLMPSYVLNRLRGVEPGASHTPLWCKGGVTTQLPKRCASVLSCDFSPAPLFLFIIYFFNLSRTQCFLRTSLVLISLTVLVEPPYLSARGEPGFECAICSNLSFIPPSIFGAVALI